MKKIVAVDMANGFTYIGKFNTRTVNYGSHREAEDWLEKVFVVPTISHYKIFQGSNVIQNVLEQYKRAYQELIEKYDRKKLESIRINKNLTVAMWNLD